MAVAALLFWLCTAAVGGYLLATSAARSGNPDAEPAEPVSVSAEQPAATVADQAATTVSPASAPARPMRYKDLFDPPSLQRAKSEPLPGLKDLAEFGHPALALIGLGIWLGYVVSRDRVFAAIGLGVLLGAICAGVSWFIVNTRAARRASAAGADSPVAPAPGSAPLSASPRLLTMHAVGAVLTLLFAVLIVVRA